jgi:hypothetical protein
MYAACGWCIYDWAYEVKGLDLSKDAPAEVISGPPCDKTPDVYNYTLPLASKSSGIVCDYIEAGVLSWTSMDGRMGRLHMPCREQTASYGPCDDGLTCTNMPTNSICLKTCTQDSDCPLSTLLKCTDGLCRLARTW